MNKKNNKLSFYEFLITYKDDRDFVMEAIEVILNDSNFPKQETKKIKIIEYLDTKEGDVSYFDGHHVWCVIGDFVWDKYKPIKKMKKHKYRKMEYAVISLMSFTNKHMNDKQIRKQHKYNENYFESLKVDLDLLKDFFTKEFSKE